MNPDILRRLRHGRIATGVMLAALAAMPAAPATAATPPPTQAPPTQAPPTPAAPTQAMPAPAQSRLEAASAALARGDLGAARELFEAVRREQPTLAGPYLGLSDVLVRSNDLAGAERILQDGIQASRPVGALYEALGLLYALENKPDLAIASYERGIVVGDNPNRARLALANVLTLRLNQPARAIPYFDAVIGAEPDNAAAHYGKGIALARLQRGDKPDLAAPLAELETAQRLDPASPFAPFTIGQLRARAGDTDQALAALDEAIRRKPDFMPARITKANLLQVAGRLKEAITTYEAALQQQPNSAAALTGLGIAQFSSGDPVAAEASYRRALAADPRQAIAMNNLANLLADRKEHLDEALNLARKAVELVPTEASFADTLGWVQYQRGDLTDAEASYKQSLSRQATAETLTRLAQLRADLGRKDEAAADYRRALELRPGYPPAEQGLRKLR